MKTGFARMLATWFGCGLFPYGPGTVGSLAAVAIGLLASRAIPLTGQGVALAGLVLFFPAVWAAGVTARNQGQKDPALIVVDEVVGQWITLAGATHLNWKSWLAGFVLFRAFDITKPFPVRGLERLPGGLGIVADDAGAGIYAALVLFLIESLMWFTF